MKGLSTNNLIAEKDYSKSHRLSKVAKSRNPKVKAKAIRNSMNLINSDNFEAEKKLQKITPLLTDRETNWDDQHKMKLKLSVIKKIENGRKKKDYIKTMLVDCKSWGGFCASVNGLQLILRQNLDPGEKVINTEMAFTHS